MDSYLVDSGKLGFVITWTVFQSELTGRGFRRRHLPEGTSCSFVPIDDIVSLKVFEDATNQTSVVMVGRRPTERNRIPVTPWNGIQSQTGLPSLEIEGVRELTNRRNLFAEPVDANDDSSPLLIMPRVGLEASLALRRLSPYLNHIREGVNYSPASWRASGRDFSLPSPLEFAWQRLKTLLATSPCDSSPQQTAGYSGWIL